MNNCFFCENLLSAFLTTPLIQTPDGTLHSCCENCADKNFPNWDDDDD